LARGNDQTAESPQLVANSFIRDAEEYVESARQLIAAQGRGTRKIMRSYPSIYFQLSHAIELALKAYLGEMCEINQTGAWVGSIMSRSSGDNHAFCGDTRVPSA
jgi:hypothetical protein